MIQPILYVDSYAVLNLLIDYFLLLGTGQITHAIIHRKRLWLASAFGCLYSIFSLPGIFSLPREITGVLSSLPFMLAIGCLMILISFGRRFFLRRLISFFILSAALCGLFQLFFRSRQLHLPLLILLSALFALLLYYGFSGRAARSRRRFCQIELQLSGQKVLFQALEDTGNHLRDPLTGRPVFVVEWNSLKTLFPFEVRYTITQNSFRQPEHILTLLNTAMPHRFFLLPFRSVGAQHGLLVAFRPDSASLNGTVLENITVAISGDPIGGDAEYTALTSAI